jgi:predicted dehydrogenase
MAAQLRAGVVGAGILGSQHAAYLYERADAKLVAVADVRLATAQQVAGKLGAAAYTTVQEMLAAQRLDLVVVATPDPLHREPSMAALEAGVPNIIQEKPLATTLADAEAIYEQVERRGARFFVNYANRAAPLDIATAWVIRDGLLGEVVYGESRLDDNITVPTEMWGTRTKDWAAGSSTAHFLLSHVVDLMRWFLAPDDITEVYAIQQQRVLGYTPDLYDAFLTFRSGCKIRVKAEWIKYIDELVEFYLCFSGAEGTLIYNKRGGFGTAPGWRANLAAAVDAHGLTRMQDKLLAKGVNVAAKIHRPSPTTGNLSAGGEKTMHSLEYNGLGYGHPMALVGCFLDAIAADTLKPGSWSGPGPLPTHCDGLAQTRVVAAIVESAQTGRLITIS